MEKYKAILETRKFFLWEITSIEIRKELPGNGAYGNIVFKGHAFSQKAALTVIENAIKADIFLENKFIEKRELFIDVNPNGIDKNEIKLDEKNER